MTRPNVVVLTNLTTRNSLPVIEALWKSSELDLCHVIFSDRMARSRPTLGQVIGQFGLRSTLVKIAGLYGRKARLLLRQRCGWTLGAAPKFSHEFVVAHRIPFTIERDLNAHSCLDLLSNLAPDVLVVCNLSQIVTSKVTSAARRGAINIHLSLLPMYRGPLPVFWALYHGEEKTGVTFHLITDGIDEGDIIAQFEVPVGERANEEALTTRLFAEAGAHIVNVLRDFVAGRLPPRPQDASRASYQTFPNQEQRRTLAQRRSKRGPSR